MEHSFRSLRERIVLQAHIVQDAIELRCSHAEQLVRVVGGQDCALDLTGARCGIDRSLQAAPGSPSAQSSFGDNRRMLAISEGAEQTGEGAGTSGPNRAVSLR